MHPAPLGLSLSPLLSERLEPQTTVDAGLAASLFPTACQNVLCIPSQPTMHTDMATQINVLTLIRAAGGVYDFRNFEQV